MAASSAWLEREAGVHLVTFKWCSCMCVCVVMRKEAGDGDSFAPGCIYFFKILSGLYF